MPRKEERLPELTRCEIKSGDEKISAVVTTISRTGLSFKSDKILPTFRVIDIGLYFGKKTIHLKGSVRWVNEQIRENKPNFHEIGVAILNPPEDYLNLFAAKTQTGK